MLSQSTKGTIVSCTTLLPATDRSKGKGTLARRRHAPNHRRTNLAIELLERRDTPSTTVVPSLSLLHPSAQISQDAELVELPVSATEVGGAHLTFVATGLPPGLTINSSTGAISGTISSTADLNSPYNTTITASDGISSISAAFAWLVNNPSPTGLAKPGNQTNLDRDTIDLVMAATGGNTTNETFSARGLPPGLAITGSTGAITGTLANTADATSPYAVTVSCTNGPSTTQESFFWSVNPIVAINAVNDQTNVIGAAVSLQTGGQDAHGSSLTFAATGLPSGLAINSNTGVVSGTVNAGADAHSPYTVTLTVSDASQSAETSFTWNIGLISLAYPGVQISAVGDSVSLPLQAASASGSSLSFSATGLPDGLSINTSTGVVSGTLAADAVTTTPDVVAVTTTSGTNSTTQTFTWTVANITLTAVGDQLNHDGDTVSLALSAHYHGSSSVIFSASGLPSGLTINSSTGAISGTIAANADTHGPYAVTLTVAAGTMTATTKLTWLVKQQQSTSSILPIVSGVSQQLQALQDQSDVADQLANAIDGGNLLFEGAYEDQVLTMVTTASQLYDTINNELEYYTTAAYASFLLNDVNDLLACEGYVEELQIAAQKAADILFRQAYAMYQLGEYLGNSDFVSYSQDVLVGL
jgi:hypothetical protein